MVVYGIDRCCPFLGANFTWCNDQRRNGATIERIDQYYIKSAGGNPETKARAGTPEKVDYSGSRNQEKRDQADRQYPNRTKSKGMADLYP